MNLTNLIDKNLLSTFFTKLKETHLDNVVKHVPIVGKSMKSVLSIDEQGNPKWVRITDMLNRLDTFMDAPDQTDEYKNAHSYGVTFKKVDMSGISRIGNAELHKTCPIQNNFRGCIEQNGVVQYYLDANDWRKKADGTESRLDGFDGNVAIDTYSDFYIHFQEIGEDCYVRISQEHLGNDWIRVPRLLIHAFRSTQLRSKAPADMGWLSTLPVNSMVSVVNSGTYLRGGTNSASYDNVNIFASHLNKPTTNIRRQTARSYFRLNGYENLNFYQYMYYFVWLFVIEYCTFNSQADIQDDDVFGLKRGGLGPSCSTADWGKWSSLNGNCPICPNGYFKDCGNKTAFKSEKIDDNIGIMQFHSWHGFQNAFGDIWTNLDGVTLFKDTTTNTTRWELINDPKKYTDGVSDDSDTDKVSVSGGFNSFNPIQIYFGDKGLIIPTKSGGSSSTGTCDYFWNNTASPACLLVGGDAYDGVSAGFFHLNVGDSVACAYSDVALRGAISPRTAVSNTEQSSQTTDEQNA